jgi:hypothetical protein
LRGVDTFSIVIEGKTNAAVVVPATDRTRPITALEFFTKYGRREARREHSTKNLLAVKIMLVIGNRINYSVATFLGKALSFSKRDRIKRAFAIVHFKGIALPQLFDG